MRNTSLMYCLRLFESKLWIYGHEKDGRKWLMAYAPTGAKGESSSSGHEKVQKLPGKGLGSKIV